uniref:Thioredoxin domain-containing protein n=1 Tax=Caenorhabditis tropicalis TaxID=1561998 RepID=A0A1I7UZ66_9PELO
MSIRIQNSVQLRRLLEERKSAPVILYFKAEWNRDCTCLHEPVETTASNYSDHIPIVSIDIDACPDVALQYSVKTTPHFKLLVQGVEEHSFTGKNLKSLQEMVTKALQSIIIFDENVYSAGVFTWS